MSTHILRASQTIDRPIEDVFRFFAEPRNLARITPPSMGFEFLSDDFEMRDGLQIDYRLRPLLGVPVNWRTGITSFDPPHRFTDVQLKGPYRRWEHTHIFEAVDGGTRVSDTVEYQLPLGPLGDLAHRLVVRGELERIFRHRERTIDAVFAASAANPDARRVAVAGGTGFVGGAIAAELHRRGHHVVVLSHRGEAARGQLPDDVELRTADVTEPDRLAAALAGIDLLVIALAFPNSPIEAPRKGRTFEAVDAQGTEHLIAAARAAGVARVVYISGAGAAPDAKRHWFRAKWRAEEAVRGSGLTWTVIRPTWIYGPGDVSLNRFVGFARRLRMVPMTNFGTQQLAPVFVDDIARLAADSLVDAAAVGPGVRDRWSGDALDAPGHRSGAGGRRAATASHPRTHPAHQAPGGAADAAAVTATDAGRHRLHQPARDRGHPAPAGPDAPATARRSTRVCAATSRQVRARAHCASTLTEATDARESAICRSRVVGGGLQRGDVELAHLEHGGHRPTGTSGIGVAEQLGERRLG